MATINRKAEHAWLKRENQRLKKQIQEARRERCLFMRVMGGMVEYSECNDPGNPWLNGARAVLRDGGHYE